MRPHQKESRRLLGSPGIYIPEWHIKSLIYAKLGRDNSLPRQPTNPLDYMWCASPKLAPPCSVAPEGPSFVPVLVRERIHKLLLRKNGSLASGFEAETLAPGILKSIFDL